MKGHGFRWALALPLVALGASCGQGEEPAQRQEQRAAVPPSIRYEARISAGGLPPPGATPRNPHAGDEEAAEAGAGLFASMNCDGCHGGGAVGWVGPSLADGRWHYGGTDAAIYQSIFYGRPEGMPAFGGALPSDAIWMLVTYLQSLPVPAAVPTQSWEKP